MTGQVKFFNNKYGFVDSGDRAQFFFLRSSVIGEIHRGDEVDYWLAEGERGDLRAVDVKARAQDGAERLRQLLAELLARRLFREFGTRSHHGPQG